jgi:hypothetical protein
MMYMISLSLYIYIICTGYGHIYYIYMVKNIDAWLSWLYSNKWIYIHIENIDGLKYCISKHIIFVTYPE